MRVSMIGQAAFGEAALRRLQAEGVEIVGISAPAPRDPARPDPLWKAAEEAGIALLDTASLKSPEGLSRWAALAGDLCVMAFVTEILPDGVFGLPPKGTVQYHPSLLPLHRGSSAINWAIINGDAETGLTMFWPDRGIDTGPILLQKRCPIGPDDTVGSLYFEKLFPMGIDAVAESVALVAAGKEPHDAQDHAMATYEPPCADHHGEIRWYEPANQVYARIRGCNPQPGAWTTFGGAKLRIFDSRLTGDHAPGMPGRVLAVDGDGVTVRLNGGVLRVLRVQPEGGKKTSAGEWAAAAGLQEGFRFR
ncbi:MAG: methionyl-tRNA formyltransferase [Chloroflexi bacterium]|nr:methionyl-tRNA formyltransferase [Chloroflexota bacterium]